MRNKRSHEALLYKHLKGKDADRHREISLPVAHSQDAHNSLQARRQELSPVSHRRQEPKSLSLLSPRVCKNRTLGVEVELALEARPSDGNTGIPSWDLTPCATTLPLGYILHGNLTGSYANWEGVIQQKSTLKK